MKDGRCLPPLRGYTGSGLAVVKRQCQLEFAAELLASSLGLALVVLEGSQVLDMKLQRGAIAGSLFTQVFLVLP